MKKPNKIDIKRASDGRVMINVIDAAGRVIDQHELTFKMSITDYNDFARHYSIESGAELILPRRECRRCGHTWVARIVERPAHCPKCGSPSWDRAKKK